MPRLGASVAPEAATPESVTLASPATTDEHCLPLVTASIYSCWDAHRAMINVWRWETGTEEYANDLWGYQIYVINHEVGMASSTGTSTVRASGTRHLS